MQPSASRRHSISKVLLATVQDVQVAVDGERMDTLAATLTDLAQRLQGRNWRSAAELLQEFPAGSVPGVLASMSVECQI
jgi:hypothetical protein